MWFEFLKMGIGREKILFEEMSRNFPNSSLKNKQINLTYPRIPTNPKHKKHEGSYTKRHNNQFTQNQR